MNPNDKTAKKLARKNQKVDMPPALGFNGRLLSKVGMFLTKSWTNFSYAGQEHIPSEAPYVLAPNHQTYVDGLWVMQGLPQDHIPKVCSLVGADLETEHGLMGKIIMQVARPIPVDRTNNRKAVRTLINAIKVCSAGNIILVHPEGTRTHDGKLAPLQSGAAYIAYKSQSPLIPVYIAGGYDIFSRHDKWPKRKNPATGDKFDLQVIYGKALDYRDYPDAHALNAALADWLSQQEKSFFAGKQL